MPKYIYYSDDYYNVLLARRERKIAAALSTMRNLPRDMQERILRESGVYDMPKKGYYSSEREYKRDWGVYDLGQRGFY